MTLLSKFNDVSAATCKNTFIIQSFVSGKEFIQQYLSFSVFLSLFM